MVILENSSHPIYDLFAILFQLDHTKSVFQLTDYYFNNLGGRRGDVELMYIVHIWNKTKTY